MNEGAAISQDGSPRAGKGTTGTACGRLLAYFREYSGQDITGGKMDDDVRALHGDRDASTRKRGICEQIDPRVEWITCTRRRVDGRLLFLYRHEWTRGRIPHEKPLRANGLTPDKRMEQINTGERRPPPNYYRTAIERGLLPEGFTAPAQPTTAPVAAPQPALTSNPRPAANVAPPGCLFDGRPIMVR